MVYFPDPSKTMDTVCRVSEVTRRMKRALEEGVGELWVEGEVSNVRRPASGHLYFTLKDETAQLRAVFFRGHQRRTAEALRDGLKVRVFGGVTLYEKSGDCQINVLKLEAGGTGTLQERFERLKKQLAEEGLFDQARKRRLPLLPRHVGVVTSPTGAAIRDMLNVIARRFPNIHLIVAPVRVQGDGAAEEIAEAIKRLNRYGGLDVIIVTRGGGSLEDLWCFNEECVARAIASSVIPVISAVGHEIDFTISDFAADLRAPTPSAAAELVVGRKEDYERQLLQLQNRMQRMIGQQRQWAKERLKAVLNRPALRNPLALLRGWQQETDQLRMYLVQAMRGRLERERKGLHALMQNTCFQQPDRLVLMMRHRVQASGRGMQTMLHLALERSGAALEQQQARLHHAAVLELARRKNAADRTVLRLNSANPGLVLKRGYTMTCSSDGQVITSSKQAAANGILVTRWQDGSVRSAVLPKQDVLLTEEEKENG
ncbi:MAG: exodeoxyribonuclease VII large subunit [Kiritimatiellae bacterium]|nr:exodeoxyribonuclease VII large subunit [Kiritimatiellia bacterium]